MLEGLTPPVKNWNCKVRTILGELDAKDKAILENALADYETWPAKTLANALTARGLKMTDNIITRHRKGLCSC